jgi:Rieske 2Fe-2S family protein
LPLVDGDGSCGRALVCPYHRWNYGLDGSLRSVPQRDQFPDLDRESLGLVGVRVDVWKTLIFVTLDDQIEPLEEWMAGLDSLFPNFHPDQLVEVSDQLHEVQSNWKLYVENHVDWLHLWYLHADSLGHYNHGAGRRHEFGRHWASFEYVSDKVDQGDTAADDATNGDVESSPVADVAEDGLLPIPGLSDSEAGNGAHFVFPALTLFTNDVYWMLGQVIPVDATSFRLRLRVFAVEGSDGAAFEPIVNVVMHEDYSVTEAIQRVVASPLFSVGPMAASYEHQIMRFHQHYLDFVSPPGRGTE